MNTWQNTLLFALVAGAALFANAHAGSCTPRGDDVVSPFESAECTVTKSFTLRCTARIRNDDPSWTDDGIVVVDFGYDTVAPHRVKLGAHNPALETLTVEAEAALEAEGKGPLMALPPQVTLKLFGRDEQSVEQVVHTWIGMFTDAMVPDTTSVEKLRNVLFVGARGSGKSTLVNSLVHVHYHYRPRQYITWRHITEEGTTKVGALDIDNPTGRFSRSKRYKMRLVDTPGFADDADRETVRRTLEDDAVNHPEIVVLVAAVEEPLNTNTDLLFEEAQRACTAHGVPMLAVGTKVDAYDAEYVKDCVTTKKAQALEKRAHLPQHEGVHWLFTHNVNCEDSTVRAPYSDEAYSFEASTFKVLAAISNKLASPNTEPAPEEKVEL